MNTRMHRIASLVFCLFLLVGALAAQEPTDSAARADSLRDDSLWHARLRSMRGPRADTAPPPRSAPAARAKPSSGPRHPNNDPSVPGPNEVVIYQFIFKPKVITVPAGTTISWVNHDIAAHTTTRNGGADQFDSGDMKMNRVFTHSFDTPGRYDYICFYHPGMKGTVIVTPAEPASSTADSQSTGAPKTP